MANLKPYFVDLDKGNEIINDSAGKKEKAEDIPLTPDGRRPLTLIGLGMFLNILRGWGRL